MLILSFQSFQGPDNLFTSQWRKRGVPMRVVVVVVRVEESYESHDSFRSSKTRQYELPSNG